MAKKKRNPENPWFKAVELDKENIIANVKLYKQGEHQLKPVIQGQIKTLANKFNIEIKGDVPAVNIQSAINNLSDGTGYKVSLPRLYSSL